MKTVLINAVSVREGGPLVVLRELLVRMSALRPVWHWHVATNERANSAVAGIQGVTSHVYPDRSIGGLRVRWWYEQELPRLIAQTRADLLFSQTNYLPSRPLPCPSLLLVQHAGHFSEVFKRLVESEANFPSRLSWRMKSRWVRSSVRAAHTVTVQTGALADRIQEELGIPRERIAVIPHGTGLAAIDAGPRTPRLSVGRPPRIGCISKHGVQKNFDVLLRAAAILKARGLRTTVVLTLDADLPATRLLMARASDLGVQDLVENHGELQPAQIDALYRTLDLFVFPSLCESFGFPLVEAMAYGLPLVTADTASNRDVGGDAAVPFDPYAECDLARCLEQLITDSASYSERSRASLARAACFSWEASAADSLALMEEMMCRGGRAA